MWFGQKNYKTDQLLYVGRGYKNTFTFEEETVSEDFVIGGMGRAGKESVNDVVTTLFVPFWIGFGP